MYRTYRDSRAKNSKLLVNLTNEASVSGKTETAIGTEKPVYTFLGIPYAAPPVGERRFQPPAKLEYWTGTRVATKHGPICPQDYEMSKVIHGTFPMPEEISEDCLHLNIYTPDPDPKKKYPVMFWIYGGGFLLGFSNCYNGTALAAYHDVVFVSINYRLGIFGFLCTGEDGVVNGNAGLLDQIAALQWVQQHIATFGGDPDNVTIFGESSGGISASLLLASDLSKGLFHRAISESGVLSFPVLIKTQETAGKSLRSHLAKKGFTSKDSQEILNYLKSLSTEDLNKMQEQEFFMSIVCDNNVLKDTPENIYKAKLHQQLDYILGFNANEGGLAALSWINSLSTKEEAQEYLQDLVENQCFKNVQNVHRITEAACKRYVDGKKDEELQKSMMDAMADMMYVSTALDLAEKHSESSRTFVYIFDHHPSLNLPGTQTPDWVKGDHGDEIFLVLGVPFLELPKHVWTEEEKQLSMNIMKYWTNFAKTGDPNGGDLPKWPSYAKPENRYIILKDKPQVASNYKTDMVEFWMKTVPDIIKSN